MSGPRDPDPDDPLGLGRPAPEPPPLEDPEAIDVVTSVGELDAVVVLLREFLHRSGAVRAVGAVDGPQAALVDCAQLQPVVVTLGERVVHLAHAQPLDVAPAGLPDVRQLPAFEVDPAAGEVRSPLGGLEHYGRAVRDLAVALGGRSVALVTFRTTDPAVPLSLTARAGDPMVLLLGEEEYEMEPGWPGA